ncbi:MAG TPA: nitrogenase cofactor biosynthesis protein NifB [Anaerolineae bacterium]|nr:nitrogenase cofactor biosynthesis protein NifB [Anaerolineae bacterium]
MTLNLANHPCFNDKARHTYGRVHLPVAPKCNVQCNFCNRKYDCVNESRPGVTSAVLSPYQALAYLDQVMAELDNISVVGIAGPGDPFANAERTLETLQLVRAKYPRIILCLATNGLGLPPYVKEVADLQVSHVTITVNAVDPAIGAKIYAWARYGKKLYRPEEGAEILLKRQLEAIQGLKKHGVTVKVNTIIMPGINDDHIEAVAQKMAELGVDILNCMSYYPTSGSAFENMMPPSPQRVTEVRQKAGVYLPLMHHCARCRADAVGLLGEGTSEAMMQKLQMAKQLPRQPQPAPRQADTDRPYIAVTSREGVLVNQHLGEADQIFVYGHKNGSIDWIETRPTPTPGSGLERWQQLSQVIGDCRALLVSGIGASPKEVLTEAGIEILEVEGLIDEAVKAVFEERSLNHLLKRGRTVCGAACSGTSQGCG